MRTTDDAERQNVEIEFGACNCCGCLLLYLAVIAGLVAAAAKLLGI